MALTEVCVFVYIYESSPDRTPRIPFSILCHFIISLNSTRNLTILATFVSLEIPASKIPHRTVCTLADCALKSQQEGNRDLESQHTPLISSNNPTKSASHKRPFPTSLAHRVTSRRVGNTFFSSLFFLQIVRNIILMVNTTLGSSLCPPNLTPSSHRACPFPQALQNIISNTHRVTDTENN